MATLAACAGAPASDDAAPHRFSELRIGRSRPSAEAEAAPAPPPAETPVRQAQTRTVAAPASVAPPAVVPAQRRPVRSASAQASAVSHFLAAGVDSTSAVRRVEAYLATQGFSAEENMDGGAQVVTATRMAEPRRLAPEAACSLEAMRRPDFSAANLTVRLSPGGQGLDIGVQSSFVEVNTNLISGTLVREPCRSRGVLESGVRRAALGG